MRVQLASVFILAAVFEQATSSGPRIEHRQAGFCAIYAQPPFDGDSQMPFFNNTPAVRLDRNDSLYRDIQAICGPASLDLLAGESPSVCCSPDQVLALEANFGIVVSMLGSCSACLHNFIGFWCRFTCSRNQSLFLDVNDITPANQVRNASVYVEPVFADALFDSCKEVKYGAANLPALDFIAPGAKNGMDFLRKVGLSDYNPLKIYFPEQQTPMPEPSMVRMNDSMAPCHSGPSKCICTDCSAACPVVEDLPGESICVVGPWQCFAFASLLGYIFVSVIIIAFGVARLFFQKYFKNPNKNIFLIPSVDDDLSIAESESLPLMNRGPSVTYLTWPIDRWLQKVFFAWGKFCAANCWRVIVVMTIVTLTLSHGLIFFEVETKPVRLWVDPESAVLKQKEFFDSNFGPFYRITQLIFTRKNSDQTIYDWNFLNQTLGLQKEIEKLVVPIPSAITDKVKPPVNLSLVDLCFRPTDLGCATQSFYGWYESNPYTKFEDDKDLNVMRDCIRGPADEKCLSAAKQPLNPNLVLGGISTLPNANASSPNWDDARAVVMTFVLNNFVNESDAQAAVLWEKAVIDMLSTIRSALQSNSMNETKYSHLDLSDIVFAFSTESSVEEELSSETSADVQTIILSYVFMFLYASLALGKIRFSRNILYIMVDSKFSLGLAGIVIVIASIVSAAGLLSFIGIKATLIIAEVIPFLVLAVGVDNIFILSNTFDRVAATSPDLKITHQVALALGHVGPSLLLSSATETIAFALGTFVSMPAVSAFSLYAATAVATNFLLQITCFVAVLTLDARRIRRTGIDCIPCIRVNRSQNAEDTDSDEEEEEVDHDVFISFKLRHLEYEGQPFLEKIFQNYYAPLILNRYVRFVVIVVFISLCYFLGLRNMTDIELGLDQRVALPKTSYLQDYFKGIEEYLEVGPPLYFVVQNDKVDVTTREGQRALCGKFVDCNEDSISFILEKEYRRHLAETSPSPHGYTTIATPTSVWFDDFLLHLNNVGEPCCVEPDNKSQACWARRSIRPKDDELPVFNNSVVAGCPEDPSFYVPHIRIWMDQIPNEVCPNSGKAAYGNAISFDSNGNKIVGYHLRTYHEILRTQRDFIGAYADAKRIANDIMKESLHITDPEELEASVPPVYPYSVFYVFFDQYEHITNLAATLIGIALAAIFVMITLLLGSPLSAFLTVLVVTMMIVNLLGVMAIWGISLNAVSTVNLVIAVGIGVEFCIHVARGVVCSYTNVQFKIQSKKEEYDVDSVLPDHILTMPKYPRGLPSQALEQEEAPISPQNNETNECDVPTVSPAQHSLVELGSSVFSGITLTKLIGICVLAYAHSQIFEIYYFRMYLAIVLLGASHGLIFLPTLLATCGVGVRNDRAGIVYGPEGAWFLHWLFRKRNYGRS